MDVERRGGREMGEETGGRLGGWGGERDGIESKRIRGIDEKEEGKRRVEKVLNEGRGEIIILAEPSSAYSISVIHYSSFFLLTCLSSSCYVFSTTHPTTTSSFTHPDFQINPSPLFVATRQP